jgi:hypothetical protein
MLGHLLYIFYIILFYGDRFPKNNFLCYHIFEETACQVKITPLTMIQIAGFRYGKYTVWRRYYFGKSLRLKFATKLLLLRTWQLSVRSLSLVLGKECGKYVLWSSHGDTIQKILTGLKFFNWIKFSWFWYQNADGQGRSPICWCTGTNWCGIQPEKVLLTVAGVQQLCFGYIQNKNLRRLNATPCRLTNVYLHFIRAYCLHP